MKPRIISAIQAGFPNSSSFATIGMWASLLDEAVSASLLHEKPCGLTL
jgi:hypothetical protein